MAEIVPPRERVCERCGRHDVWDEGKSSWIIASAEGEKEFGSPYCLHEWDISGTYNPLA
ncbi:HEWD family protein [Halomicroarcula sp. GCM10025324]|jgi:hypothetical protein|uniref:HEWD family protein n=1 Tax=Haloarcula TaxID=2237 RepID=UPI0023E76476|nr:HEWD family protein [Halomicroarcula sp. ZS-22-S1]